jgi:hypothetical protein
MSYETLTTEWILTPPSSPLFPPLPLPLCLSTKTKETRWTRPDTDLVIPLSSIQINTLYSSQSRRRASSPAISAVVSPSSSKHRPRHRSKLSAPPTSFPLNSSPLTSGSKQDNASHRTPRVRTNSAPTLSKTPEAESSPRRPKLERLRMSSIGSPTLDLSECSPWTSRQSARR